MGSTAEAPSLGVATGPGSKLGSGRSGTDSGVGGGSAAAGSGGFAWAPTIDALRGGAAGARLGAGGGGLEAGTRGEGADADDAERCCGATAAVGGVAGGVSCSGSGGLSGTRAAGAFALVFGSGSRLPPDNWQNASSSRPIIAAVKSRPATRLDHVRLFLSKINHLRQCTNYLG